MKFIDEKGRVLGVLNIFDLFVLLLLIATTFFSLRWALIAKDPSWMKVRTYNIQCIGLIAAPAYIAEAIREGDASVSDDGIMTARISKILDIGKPGITSTTYTYVTKDGQEKLLLEVASNDKYNDSVRMVTVMVELSVYDKKGDVYSALSSLPLRIGDGLTFSTKKYSVQIIIRKILG